MFFGAKSVYNKLNEYFGFKFVSPSIDLVSILIIPEF